MTTPFEDLQLREQLDVIEATRRAFETIANAARAKTLNMTPEALDGHACTLLGMLQAVGPSRPETLATTPVQPLEWPKNPLPSLETLTQERDKLLMLLDSLVSEVEKYLEPPRGRTSFIAVRSAIRRAKAAL